MRKDVLMRVGIGVGGLVAAAFVIWAAQQGMFGGQAKRLLARAQQLERSGQLADAQALLEELVGTHPDSPWADNGLLQLGQVYDAQQQLLEARATYRMLLERFPDSALAVPTQERLGAVNVALLLSPAVTAHDTLHVVKRGDTLAQIAKAYRTTVDLLQRANGISGALIRPGQQLKVPSGTFRVTVDKSQNQLLLTSDEEFVKVYSVATGAESSTPAGTFTVVNKIVNPVWYKEGAAVPAGSPENILGTRWLGFDRKGYGIHGTIDESAIGQQVTAGCVRMRNADVEELFAILPVGTSVTIVD